MIDYVELFRSFGRIDNDREALAIAVYKNLFNIASQYRGKEIDTVLRQLKALAAIREPALMKWVALFSAKFYSLYGQRTKARSTYCIRSFIERVCLENDWPSESADEVLNNHDDCLYLEDIFLHIVLLISGHKSEERNDFLENRLFYKPLRNIEPLAPLDRGKWPICYNTGCCFTLNAVDSIYVWMSEYQLGVFKLFDKSGRCLADEEPFNEGEPLYFTDSEHFVSPVYRLRQARLCVDAALEYLTVELKPTLAAVVATGHDCKIINYDDMLEVWDEDNIRFVQNEVNNTDASRQDEVQLPWLYGDVKFDTSCACGHLDAAVDSQVRKALTIAAWCYSHVCHIEKNTLSDAMEREFNTIL